MSARLSVVADVSRTARLVSLFRHEQSDPDRFYRFLAGDTVARVQPSLELSNAVVLDVGGGPGYVADAFRLAGARCFVAEFSSDELHLHGRSPEGAMQADGQALPIRSSSVDVCHSSNVLEHVPDPRAMLAEVVRVVRPGGVIYLSFTNWLSPWGGHETSPWHYLGGEYAARRWLRRHGSPPKNRYGQGLYRLDVSTVLAWFRTRPDVEMMQAGPRYWPAFARPVVSVPGVREIVTWNLEIIARRR